MRSVIQTGALSTDVLNTGWAGGV